MPYGDYLAIRPRIVDKDLLAVQAAVERLIRAIRATEKAEKAVLEADKDLVMFQLKGRDADSMEARRTWLETNYVPRLRNIGLTRAELSRRLGTSFRVTADAITTSTGEKLFDVFEGDEAFEQIVTGEAVARPVFRKKGDLQQGSVGEKHYVKDDFGYFTRRYAYVEKPWDVFEILLVHDSLTGKDVVSKLGGDPFSKGKFAKLKYNFSETGNADRMSIREMAFVNQEDGSTIQRGLPITSTSKSLHGNTGFRFGNFEGVCLKIDLALIANDATNLLLNLHSFDAQQNSTIGLDTYRFKPGKRTGLLGSAADSKTHTDRSTSKNREAVLLKIPLFAIRAVAFHNAISASVYSDFVKRCISESGGLHAVETSYVPHSAVAPDELFE